jgi:hypothetical protein
MRKWYLALAGPALAGCGDVVDKPDLDGRACAGDTVQACGLSCVACEVSGDRAVPTCDGTACGFACKGGAPTCSDNTCSRTLWDFESGSVDGITPRTPNGLALAARNFNGAGAMAIDVASLGTEISFRIPVCLSGVVDVRSKTFSLQVFFQGAAPGGEQYYVQASVPSPQTGAYLGNRGIAAQMWTAFSAPLDASQFSGTCSDVTVQVGSYGAAFAGTIWFDDLKIE